MGNGKDINMFMCRSGDLFMFNAVYGGHDCTVGIATHYGLNDPGFKLWWGQDFP